MTHARRQFPSQRPAGFSLVELLVVIGVIAVLIGLLLPVLGRARQRSRAVACMANMTNLKNAFQMYFNDSRERLPYVNPTPYDPTDPTRDLVLSPNPRPTIVQTFEPYLRGGEKVWRCPGDSLFKLTIEPAMQPALDAGGDTYHAVYGTSYEYNPFVNAIWTDDKFPIVLNDYNTTVRPFVGATLRQRFGELYLFADYVEFHGPVGQLASTNMLYADNWWVGTAEGRTRIKKDSGNAPAPTP